ncbi:MAG: PEP-CTERM sorting domain-containing protein [Verrucomicrobiaceae bacterium]
MKSTHALLALFTGIVLSGSAQAVVVWTENFSAYSDGDPISGSTATGSGNLDSTTGTVSVNAAGQVLLVADGGRDAIQVNSTTSATCGILSFETAFLGDSDTAAADTDIFFLQLGEGGRSTGGSPKPNFAHTVDAGADGISTSSSSLSSVKYFFNGSAAIYTYTAPDATTQTVAPGSYDYWVGTTLIDDNATDSNNGGGIPANIDTFVAQTFNGQLGESWVFDNLQFEEFNASHVPEPSSTAILALGMLSFSLIRKRK